MTSCRPPQEHRKPSQKSLLTRRTSRPGSAADCGRPAPLNRENADPRRRTAQRTPETPAAPATMDQQPQATGGEEQTEKTNSQIQGTRTDGRPAAAGRSIPLKPPAAAAALLLPPPPQESLDSPSKICFTFHSWVPTFPHPWLSLLCLSPSGCCSRSPSSSSSSSLSSPFLPPSPASSFRLSGRKQRKAEEYCSQRDAAEAEMICACLRPSPSLLPSEAGSQSTHHHHHHKTPAPPARTPSHPQTWGSRFPRGPPVIHTTRPRLACAEGAGSLGVWLGHAF